MLDQTLVALHLSGERKAKLVKIFGGFLLSQTRAFPRLLGGSLKASLVLQVFLVGLQFSLELGDSIIRLADLLVERVPLGFEVRDLPLFVGPGPFGRKNFNAGPRRFLMRAFMTAAGLFDCARRSFKIDR